MKKEYWFVSPVGSLTNEILSAMEHGFPDKSLEEKKCYDEHGNQLSPRNFWELTYEELLSFSEEKRFPHEVFRRVGIDGRIKRYDLKQHARRKQVRTWVRRGSTEIGKRRPLGLV